MIPTTQISFESIPKDQSSSEPLQSKAWQEMVAVGGRICQLLGLPRSMRQIFGLLYLFVEPMSLSKMSSILRIYKGSTRIETRQLASWGCIRKVWIPGDREDYYEVNKDVGQCIRESFNNLIKPRLQSSKDLLAMFRYKIREDIKFGAIPSDKKDILKGQIKALGKIYNKISQFFPLIEKIIRRKVRILT